MKCNSLKIEVKPGDSKKMIFKWKCSAPTYQIDHFELVPYYYNGKNTLTQKKVNVDKNSWASGFYYVEYTTPSAATARSVGYYVYPVAKYYKTGGWRGGTYYTWEQQYWGWTSVNSPWLTVPEYSTSMNAEKVSSTNAYNTRASAITNRTNATNYEKAA